MDSEVLASLDVGSWPVELRRAGRGDVRRIVELIAADQLGATRDGIADADDLACYLHAFDAIEADASELLVVAVDGDEVVATMQLSFLPGLARRGSRRAQIEAVRVAIGHRGRGLGDAMFRWAIDGARRRG